MKTPTVSIDRKVAKEHTSVIQQGQEAPRPELPQMPTAATDARELVDQEKGEDEARGRANTNTEDQGDPHNAIEDRGDIAELMQGGLPHPDNYIQGIAIEPLTVDQPTGWWHYEAH